VLTDSGRGALRESLESLRDVRQLLAGLLDRYDSLSEGAGVGQRA
jgi:hypothetical protein